MLCVEQGSDPWSLTMFHTVKNNDSDWRRLRLYIKRRKCSMKSMWKERTSMFKIDYCNYKDIFIESLFLLSLLLFCTYCVFSALPVTWQSFSVFFSLCSVFGIVEYVACAALSAEMFERALKQLSVCRYCLVEFNTKMLFGLFSPVLD